MAADREPVLQLTDVHAGYGEIRILRGITISIVPGTVTSIIGANGAGKSTLLKTIFGMVAVTSGEIHYLGRPITDLKPDQRLRQGIAIVQQGRCNFPLMTVRENLQLGAYSRTDGRVAEDMEAVLDMFEVLRRRQKTIAGNLSGGEQQLLEMATALMVHPKVMLLDEPSLGLSPLMLDHVFAAIRNLARRRNTAIVMVEQNAVQALKISDRGVVIELGKISHEGSGPRMLEDPAVRQSYLGLPPA